MTEAPVQLGEADGLLSGQRVSELGHAVLVLLLPSAGAVTKTETLTPRDE